MGDINARETSNLAFRIECRMCDFGYWLVTSPEPGVIKVYVKAPVESETHEIIDDIIWNEFGCYKIALQPYYDEETEERIKVHWYWFDDGKIREDDFKGNMKELLADDPASMEEYFFC